MTRIKLFKALCEVTDAIEKVTYVLDRGEPRLALEGVMAQLDGLIDRCVREGVEPLHAHDTSPCPHCGQAVCIRAKEKA